MDLVCGSATESHSVQGLALMPTRSTQRPPEPFDEWMRVNKSDNTLVNAAKAWRRHCERVDERTLVCTTLLSPSPWLKAVSTVGSHLSHGSRQMFSLTCTLHTGNGSAHSPPTSPFKGGAFLLPFFFAFWVELKACIKPTSSSAILRFARWMSFFMSIWV